MNLSYRISGVVVSMVIVAASGAFAQRAERLTDKDVKELFEGVDVARDRFEDQLDGKIKNGVVRSPKGETKVSAAFDDFQQAMDKLKSRFTDNYAASAEAEAVLNQGTWFHLMMSSQPKDLDGSSEWERLNVELKRLADVYSAEFPLAEGAPVRRINDAEAATTAGAVGTQAELLKRAVKADRTLPKTDKDALEDQVEDVIKQAKTLQSRLKDGKPASAEARLLKQKVTALTPAGRQLPPAVLTPIGGLRAPLEKLDQAFGVSAP